MNVSIKNIINKLNNTYISKNFIKFYKKYNLSPYLYFKKKSKDYNLLLIYKLIIRAKNIINIINKEKGKILFVDFINPNNFKNNLINIISNSNNFYLNLKWPCGLLTNWLTFKEEIQKMIFLEINIKNSINNYSIKKLNKIKRKLLLFNHFFYGIKHMNELPDLVIFSSFKKNLLAILECKKLGIPVICLCNLYSKLEIINYPILCNINKSYFILYFLLKQLKINN